MKAVFLDRDGVINKYPGDRAYVTKWEEFSFLPKVKEALIELSANDFKIFVISNQAGVAKGLYSQTELDKITEKMKEGLGERVRIEEVFYCTHHPEDNCDCRKPKTGLVEKAIKKLQNSNFDIDLGKSFFVGDAIRDIETGKKIGLKTILVFSGKEKAANSSSWNTRPDFTAENLFEAVKIILKI